MVTKDRHNKKNASVWPSKITGKKQLRERQEVEKPVHWSQVVGLPDSPTPKQLDKPNSIYDIPIVAKSLLHMNTNTMHSTALSWAKQIDKRIKVSLALESHNYEIFPHTRLELIFRCKLTGRQPFLEIWLPHPRRTPNYFYRPDITASFDEEFFVPTFNNKKELVIALTVVYRRFMTAYGMQRFDDSQEKVPEFYRPDLIETAKLWVAEKSKPKFSLREIPSAPQNFRYGGIELRPIGKNPSGLVIRIDNDRSYFQKPIFSKADNTESGYLPAFFTESELLGTLRSDSYCIASSNKKTQDLEE